MNTSLATCTNADLHEYGQLPERVRLEAFGWHEAFLALEATGARIEAGLREVAQAMQRPFKTCRNKFFKWKKAGRSWLACVNWARVTGRQSALTPEFTEWYVRHVAGFQRNTEAGFRDFALRWKRGETLPGLDPALPRTRLPAGCTYANLQKYVRRQSLAVTALRRGLGVARSHGPQVLTTRAGLWVGSHLAIDDVWHDNFVLWQGQLVRVLQLSVLDVFSGCLPTWGTKPRHLKADGTFDNLKEKYARLVVAAHLRTHGWSPRGTEILSEHGTAAMSSHAMDVLKRWTDGKVWVRESGITGREQALAGLGLGQGKGNFRHKAHLESLHNLIHNQLGELPAQTGKDVDHRPEYTHGQLREDADLLRCARQLALTSPATAGLLQTRTLHYHGQFLPLLAATLDAINRRGEDPEIWTHELEGWADCGHILAEYRFSAGTDQWFGDAALRQLAPAAREAFLGLVAANPALLRERKLSPHEVWQPGCRALVKLPAVAVAELIGDDFAREERVVDCGFRFQDAELAPEALRYDARLTTADGFERELPNGETYQLLLNPFDLDCVFVRDAAGRDLGTVRRTQRVCRTEVEAVQEAFKRSAVRLADHIAPFRRADTAALAARTRLMNENTDLLAGELAARGIKTPGQVKREAARNAARPVADDCTEDTLARASVNLVPEEWDS